jgi:DNA-binding transcriptional regulator LsrR (DeoR family)
LASRREDQDDSRLDAARAEWLYYIAGNTQDEIAAKLGVSGQTAPLAMSEGGWPRCGWSNRSRFASIWRRG